MWYGKVSVIMLVFSLGILFFTYYFNQVFQDPLFMSGPTASTYDSVKQLMGNFSTSGISPNPVLIYGDFVNAFNLLVALFGGQIFYSAEAIMGNTGFATLADASIGLISGLMFVSATFFFILYIISNRSI